MDRLLAIFFLIGLSPSMAQTPEIEKYSSQWPDENGIFLKNNSYIDISIGKDDEPEITRTHHEKRLFFNDNAKHYIEDDVSYSAFFELLDIEPIVYILDDGKYKKNKIKDIEEAEGQSGTVFYDELKKKKFFYQGLAKGGKTELTYSTLLKQPEFYGSFFFASYLPVAEAVYEVKAPADMTISYKLFGEEADKVEYTVEEKGRHKIHRWKAKNLSPISVRNHTVNVKYYATHMQLYINEYEHKREKRYVLRDLDDLYRFYRGFVGDINQTPSEEIKRITDSLTQGLSTQEEKVKAIFYWVQDNIKYIAIEDGLGGFVPREASLVCSRRYGDCKDNTSLLKEMLTHAGIPAYYTWIGTTSIPYSYNEVPTPSADNHMICSYHNGEDYVILDGTGRHLPLGFPTAFIQGKEALIGIDKEKYVLKKVPVIDKEENFTLDSVWLNFEDDLVVGSGSVRYEGYASIYLSGHLKSLDEKRRNEFLERFFSKGNNKSTVKPLSIEHLNNRDNGLKIDYEFDIPDYARMNEDEIYFNPFLKKYESGSEIDTSLFTVDLFKPTKEMVKSVIVINAPEGYSIDYVPEPSSFAHDDFGYTIDFQTNKEKQQIILNIKIDLGHRRLYVSDFDEWNNMVDKLNAAYSELIIFKKKK